MRKRARRMRRKEREGGGGGDQGADGKVGGGGEEGFGRVGIYTGTVFAVRFVAFGFIAVWRSWERKGGVGGSGDRNRCVFFSRRSACRSVV